MWKCSSILPFLALQGSWNWPSNGSPQKRLVPKFSNKSVFDEVLFLGLSLNTLNTYWRVRLLWVSRLEFLCAGPASRSWWYWCLENIVFRDSTCKPTSLRTSRQLLFAVRSMWFPSRIKVKNSKWTIQLVETSSTFRKVKSVHAIHI